MKKFTAALIAAALVAPTLGAVPAMAQAQRHDDHRGSAQSHDDRGHDKAGAQKQTYKSFRKGQKFDRRYARNYQQVDYRKYRNLKAPPRGYHYVRSGNDLLLVGITSGIVSAVTSGMFR
ncbi:RcnB family protein [Novosphingobium sp. BL-52-GroH]|uniref:RcnB family protein n=1 Tax=Novosphingobium sp. BL-52-GroH TaxID=3349877 RepID=UPI0038508658